MTFYLKRIIGKLLLLVIWYLSSKLLKANCCVSLGTTTWYYQRCCTHTKPFSTAFGCAILRWSHISAQVSLKLKTTLSDFPFSFPFLIKNLQPYVRCYFVLVSMCFYKTQCLKITEKVAFNIASEASYIYILSGPKFIKMANFGEFLKTWNIMSNSVNRQVTFNKTNFWGKFWAIFKHFQM